jgi:Holliday junction resolvase RusA-like endonuclease
MGDGEPIRFFVPGVPQAWQRSGFNPKSGRMFTPDATRAWEKTVKTHARAAVVKARWLPVLGACYSAELVFRLPDGRRRDADNCAKACLDACNKILWLDDAQVGLLRVERILRHASPGVLMTVWRIEEPRG